MFDDVNTMQEYPQEVAQEQVQEQPVQQASPEKAHQEQNWKLLRERADAAERRAQELERLIQMNMNAQQPKEVQPDQEDDLELNDDMYIEGKQFKKYIKNLKQDLNNTKKQLEEFNKRSSQTNAEMHLKSQFTDFESIVTEENMKKLAAQKPSLYRSIMSTPDMYDRGVTAYEMIKSSGLSIGEYDSQNRRLEENRSKPRSAANVAPQAGETPLARVGDYDRRILTEARKNELLRQVELAKQYR